VQVDQVVGIERAQQEPLGLELAHHSVRHQRAKS
jgi:hypothetical protein